MRTIKQEYEYIDKDIRELEIKKHKKEFIDSLIRSIDEAGGSSVGICMNITLEEMMNILAQNNIRFTTLQR